MRGILGVVAGVATAIVTYAVLAIASLYADPCEGPDCGSHPWAVALIAAAAIVAGVLVKRRIAR
jgi:hypothetical protein